MCGDNDDASSKHVSTRVPVFVIIEYVLGEAVPSLPGAVHAVPAVRRTLQSAPGAWARGRPARHFALMAETKEKQNQHLIDTYHVFVMFLWKIIRAQTAETLFKRKESFTVAMKTYQIFAFSYNIVGVASKKRLSPQEIVVTSAHFVQSAPNFMIRVQA